MERPEPRQPRVLLDGVDLRAQARLHAGVAEIVEPGLLTRACARSASASRSTVMRSARSKSDCSSGVRRGSRRSSMRTALTEAAHRSEGRPGAFRPGPGYADAAPSMSASTSSSPSRSQWAHHRGEVVPRRLGARAPRVATGASERRQLLVLRDPPAPGHARPPPFLPVRRDAHYGPRRPGGGSLARAAYCWGPMAAATAAARVWTTIV